MISLLYQLYLMLLLLREAIEVNQVRHDDVNARNNTTMLVLVTGFSIFILEWMGRLDSGLGKQLGITDLGLEALLLSVALYALGRNLRSIEYDLGRIFSGLFSSLLEVSDWNPLTGEWSSKKNVKHIELGPAMRASMILPLLIFFVIMFPTL